MQDKELVRTLPFKIGKRKDVFTNDQNIYLTEKKGNRGMLVSRYDKDMNLLDENFHPLPFEYDPGDRDYKGFKKIEDKIYLCWHDYSRLHAAELTDKGFGEVIKTPDKWYFRDPVFLASRPVYAVEKMPDFEKTHFIEFNGESWQHITSLKSPPQSILATHNFMDGDTLNFIYLGETCERKVFTGEKWRETDFQCPPGAVETTKYFEENFLNFLYPLIFSAAAIFVLMPYLFTLLVSSVIKETEDDYRKHQVVVDEEEGPVYATLASRSSAFLVDLIIAYAFSLAIVQYFFSTYGMFETWPNHAPLLVLSFVLAILFVAPMYFFISESTAQTTVGKYLLGLKIIGLNGKKPNIKSILLRNILRPIDALANFSPGAASMAASMQRQRLGDRAAHTAVIKKQRSYS